MNQSPVTINIFSTRVPGKSSAIHFDVMTTVEATAFRLAQDYLASLGEAEAVITTGEGLYRQNESQAFFSQIQQQSFSAHGRFILPLPS
jgi:hypothetical protein